MVRFGHAGGHAQGAAADPARRRADHPRHRRRRAGRQGPSVGQPQAVEAGAATRLLHRRADDQRAQRHAQDLRADDAAFRLGQAAEAGVGRGKPSTYLLDRALRAQGIVSLDSICHLDAPSKPAIRRLIEARVRRSELVPVALEGAGKQEHWARPKRWSAPPATRAGAGAHPLAVRSAGHPAQAHRTVLRLRASLRGLCAEGETAVRLFRAAGAGRRRDRRRHRSQDRPQEAASC